MKNFFSGLEEVIARIISLIISISVFVAYTLGDQNQQLTNLSWREVLLYLLFFWFVYELVGYLLFLLFKFFAKEPVLVSLDQISETKLKEHETIELDSTKTSE